MIGQRWPGKSGVVPVEQSNDGRQEETLLKLLLVCLVTALCVGCPATVQYQPNDRLISELGLPQARQRLNDALSRSINPRITDVEITDDFVRYRYQQPIYGPYWIQMDATVAENRIIFSHIDRVEVYDNHFVFIWDTTRINVAKVLFSNDADARMFADLMSSFRTQHASSR